MRVLAVLTLAALAGCAEAPLPRLPAPSIAETVQEAPRTCPPVPEHVRAAAARRIDLPAGEAARGRLAGDAMLADLAKARALSDLIGLYERCRSLR